jgi:hypothetical protein
VVTLSSSILGYLLIASVVLLALLVAMVYQLAGFHITLLRKGMTTYDFIVSEQKRAREREEQKRKKRDAKWQQQQQKKKGKLQNTSDVQHADGGSSGWSKNEGRLSGSRESKSDNGNDGDIAMTSVGPAALLSHEDSDEES